jgi:Gas vesicle protein G
VGVIKEMALLPVAPLRFTVWIASKVAEEADHQQNSPEARVRRLREIEDARARGELDEEQAAELESRILEQAGGWGPYRG